MLLSIVIPVYNGEKYIGNCLESIIQNTQCKDIEILIVNDGSKDNTAKILEEYVTKDSRIKAYNNTNHGVSYTRNYALEKSIGEYVMFIDSDDFLSENWFAIVEADIKEGKDIVYYTSNEKLKELSKEKVIEEIMCMGEKVNFFACPFSKILKREIIQETRFDNNITNGEDMLFNLEMILKTDNYKVSNKSFYNYIVHQGSITQSFKPQIINSEKLFLIKLSEVLEKSDLKSDFVDRIKTHCERKIILSLSNKISFIPKYADAKKEFKKMHEEPYNEILKKISYKVTSKKDVLLVLNKLKFHYIVYKIFRNSNKKKFKDSIEFCIKL